MQAQPISGNGGDTVHHRFRRWELARARTLATRTGSPSRPGSPADYWAELQLGAIIVREVAADRWLVVARLLLLDAVPSWSQVADAVQLDPRDAHTLFDAWLCRVDHLGDAALEIESGLSANQVRELWHRIESVTW